MLRQREAVQERDALRKQRQPLQVVVALGRKRQGPGEMEQEPDGDQQAESQLVDRRPSGKTCSRPSSVNLRAICKPIRNAVTSAATPQRNTRTA